MSMFAQGMLQDVFEGFVVYRNLVPVDHRLPAIDALRAKLGLGCGVLPRKAEPMYARVVGEILHAARDILGIQRTIRHLLYIGDTLHNDVAAFSHLCQAMGWKGRAFIADEHCSKPIEIRQLGERELLVSSTDWGDIEAFERESTDAGLGCDASTVVVVDIDKTILGARGRNDHMIDRARQQAAYEIACSVADGTSLSETDFMQICGRINHPDFHALTDDNQDAIAYASLLVACGFYQADMLAVSVAQGRIRGMEGLVRDVDEQETSLPHRLGELHHSIRKRVEEGNPTPFTAFREAEYRCTAQLMGCLPDDAPRDAILNAEIAITEEVWTAVHEWKNRGCIIFGLSDKPDEACFPLDTNEKPIHGMRTHILGGR